MKIIIIWNSLNQVEAQFVGIGHDGKVVLHKLNGVKIGVSLDKLSKSDQEFIKKIRIQQASKNPQKTSLQPEKVPIPEKRPSIENQKTIDLKEREKMLAQENLRKLDEKIAKKIQVIFFSFFFSWTF